MPITWQTLVECLRDTDLNVLVDNIESSLSEHDRSKSSFRRIVNFVYASSICAFCARTCSRWYTLFLPPISNYISSTYTFHIAYWNSNIMFRDSPHLPFIHTLSQYYFSKLRLKWPQLLLCICTLLYIQLSHYLCTLSLPGLSLSNQVAPANQPCIQFVCTL